MDWMDWMVVDVKVDFNGTRTLTGFNRGKKKEMHFQSTHVYTREYLDGHGGNTIQYNA